MKRKSIPAFEKLAFTKQVQIFQDVFNLGNHLLRGTLKYDGIFVSVGIEDDRMYFQTANSSPCFNPESYMTWATEAEFSRELVEMFNILLKDREFQVWLRVELAHGWPDKKCLNFEYFPHKFQNKIDSKYAYTIKYKHEILNSDYLILHEDPVDISSSPIISNVFPIYIAGPAHQMATFDNTVGYEAYDALDKIDISWSSSKDKELRDQVKAGMKAYFDSIDMEPYEHFEGMVFTRFGTQFKIINPKAEKFILNPLIFGDKS